MSSLLATIPPDPKLTNVPPQIWGANTDGYASREAARGEDPRQYRRAEEEAAVHVEWPTKG